jgi:hypothetical protein
MKILIPEKLNLFQFSEERQKINHIIDSLERIKK